VAFLLLMIFIELAGGFSGLSDYLNHLNKLAKIINE
jgi:hypothetical protein